MISPILNSQNKIDTKAWEAVLPLALEAAWRRAGISADRRLRGAEPLVTVEFTSPEDIRSLNAESREVDAVTDVLSFPMLGMYEGDWVEKASPGDIHENEDGVLVLELGDIVICPERAVEQASEYGHSVLREVVFLAVHGMCHLLGYDHMEDDETSRMENEQAAIMELLGIGREAEVEVDLEALRAAVDQIELPAGRGGGQADGADPEGDQGGLTDLGLGPVDGPLTAPNGEPFRSGFISLVGRPNSGKSTLLNYLSGARLAIVSRKAQTTRHVIRSIVNTPEAQMIFVDTPGMHKPSTQLGRNMMKDTWSSFKDSDIVLLMVDGLKGNITTIERSVIKKAEEEEIPVFLAINKVDDMSKEDILPIIARYSEFYPFKAIIPISARTGDGVEELTRQMLACLPEGPRYFPEDSFTDQSERTLSAELIREQILNYTHDEIPHGTAVKIDEFQEIFNDKSEGAGSGDDGEDGYDRKLIRILATIYCEKDSHKSIIIGKKGATLKRIGTAARRQIEAMTDCKVYLELFVKVRKDWQNKDSILSTLGYDPLKL